MPMERVFVHLQETCFLFLNAQILPLADHFTDQLKQREKELISRQLYFLLNDLSVLYLQNVNNSN